VACRIAGNGPTTKEKEKKKNGEQSFFKKKWKMKKRTSKKDKGENEYNNLLIKRVTSVSESRYSLSSLYDSNPGTAMRQKKKIKKKK
jgi:hypothetical protein